ncbi:Dipeptide transport system permease protein DppB [Methylobacterium crusticola]|uniref:Dipeptide transport system permease protein DppB n=1 Tax=Methylobacterium crusticola TaxID=1697972 RepID=A0ABQ4R7P6_9HYPH|nr:ABC transporter permease [Methylobacterium crusticola]GJD53249.1 Dipeptide transport system permease protein DppB [Methylobacterium crusticola]
MLIYVLRRILYTLPIVIGVSLVCFSLIHIAPGDPLSAVMPDGASPEVMAQIRQAYGFDRPLPVQYLKWLLNMASGDFGVSTMTRRPVASEVFPAVANTLILSAAAVVIAFVLGTGLGLVSGYTAGSLRDRGVTVLSTTGVSIPHYWLGMVLVVIFAVNLNLLPATGMGSGGLSLRWDDVQHMVLPALTLAVIPAGIIARSLRGTVIDVRKQDFMQTLYAKGLPGRRVFVHVVKNALPAVLAVMGLQLAQLLGGSILVETVFAWPGTGFLLNNAIFTRDLPVLQGTILVLALFFVFINLAVDIVQSVVDPRIKRA